MMDAPRRSRSTRHDSARQARPITVATGVVTGVVTGGAVPDVTGDDIEGDMGNGISSLMCEDNGAAFGITNSRFPNGIAIAVKDPALHDRSRSPRYLKLNEVKARFGLSHSTIYRWMDKGVFPKPIRLGAGAVRWSEADLDRWIEDRATAA